MANPFDQFDAKQANPFDQFDAGAKPDETGDFMRGAKVAIGQTPAILKGAVGLVGATAEKAFGAGGIATGIKEWGLRGYQDGMQKLQPMQRETDDLTTAWDRAKGGDLGALVDWVQYGLGYAVGQAGEAAAVGILGGVAGAAAAPALAPAGAAGGAITGLVAEGAVKQTAKAMIEKAVIKEANGLMAAAAANGAKITSEEAVKQATKSVAREIGSTAALLGSGVGQELGSIYPEAEAEAAKKGEQLTGGDLARVWGAGVAAGGLEGLTDKLGLDVAFGKVKLPGMGSRAGSAVAAGAGGALIEGSTEALQTGMERYGAGQELTGDEATRDYVNSAGLGALGGAAIGGGSGALRWKAQEAAADQAMAEIGAATNIDEAIDAADRAVPPLDLGSIPSLDENGAMSRLETAMADDLSTIKQAGYADRAQFPFAGRAEQQQAAQPAGPQEASARSVADEPFADRLLTLRNQLKDSRTRQQIRDALGPEALNDVLWYSSKADDATLPGRTSDNMLALAETLVSRAIAQPMANQPQAGGPTAAPALGMSAPQNVPRLGLDTTPTGTLRVDAAGNVAPETQADVVGTNDAVRTMRERADSMAAEARARRDGMTGSFPQGAPNRLGVMVGEGTLTPAARPTPEAPRLQGPNFMPGGMTLERRFAQMAADAAEARQRSRKEQELDAIAEQAAEQDASAAAVKRAGSTKAPTAIESAMQRAAEKKGGWLRFPADSGTLSIPRAEMPQIKAEHRGALVNFLAARGITHEQETEVDPTTLKATQAEYSPAKVQQARDYAGGDRAILVSSDGYVLDGHHQWLGAMSKGDNVRVIRLDAPIRELMQQVQQFPSAEQAEGATSGTAGRTAGRPGADGAVRGDQPVGGVAPVRPVAADAGRGADGSARGNAPGARANQARADGRPDDAVANAPAPRETGAAAGEAPAPVAAQAAAEANVPGPGTPAVEARGLAERAGRNPEVVALRKRASVLKSLLECIG